MATWLPIPYKVVIIGGGISGLSAAHALVKHSKVPCDVTIVESQSIVGGWLKSTRYEDGSVFEHGPRNARSYGSTAIQALNILSDLKLEDKIIGVPKTHDAAKKRYIYAKGKLNELPSSVSSVMFRQEPFSKSLLSSIIREPFVERSSLEDESVYNFFQRRFNKEIADYLATSLCRGIFGGDAEQLSLRSCFKILFDYERQHGSVVKGAFFSKSDQPRVDSNALISRAKAENWMGWTLQNGMQTLPEIWYDHLKSEGVKFLLNTRCEEIDYATENKIHCVTSQGVIEADRVISTLPSTQLSRLLSKCDKTLSTMLDTVEYADMAVVNLEYDSCKLPYQGFGFLVPTCEPCDILGMTFDSLIFPQHTKSNSAIMTTMAGGAWFNEVFGNSESADVSKITELAVKSAHDILGIAANPKRTLCKVQRECIPQYKVGHEKKADEIKNYVKSNNLPLNILGNVWGGVGVNDVIVNARNDTLKWLAGNHMY